MKKKVKVVIENQDVGMTRPVEPGYELFLAAALSELEARFQTPQDGEAKISLSSDTSSIEEFIKVSLIGTLPLTVVRVPDPFHEVGEEWVQETVYSIGDGFHKLKVIVKGSRWYEYEEEKAQVSLAFELLTNEGGFRGSVSVSYLYKKWED